MTQFKDKPIETLEAAGYWDYLAKMDNLSIGDWVLDRKGFLKAVDKLRMFYVLQYEAKKQGGTL